MVPDGEYDMEVLYDDVVYKGTTTVNGGDAEVTLYTIAVDKVEYDSSQLTYQGGTVDFTVTGTFVADNIIIRAKPDNTGQPMQIDPLRSYHTQMRCELILESWEHDNHSPRYKLSWWKL